MKRPPLRLFDTLSKEKKLFSPINNNPTIYSCGPTVYRNIHIGNLRYFVFVDILNRVIKKLVKKPINIINLTDVGHLTDDGDYGKDKIENEASKKGLSAKEIIESASDYFFNALTLINIPKNNYKFPRASKYIDKQIDLIKKLEKEGYTYKTSIGIYFDTNKFNKYGSLGNINLDSLKEGARIGKDNEKRNVTDFALWKFSPKQTKRQQEWNSPWGIGFPGWHIECSALAINFLGESIDIHTGGIEHIPVHHNNEIAQSESITKKKFARFWLHSQHLIVDNTKMSKSIGNVIFIEDIIKKNISPAALRYFFLTAHYRSKINFRWDAIASAATALHNINRFIEDNKKFTFFVSPHKETMKNILVSLSDDLNTPKALAYIWDMIRDKDIPVNQKIKTLFVADKLLGLDLGNDQTPPPPKEAVDLLRKRDNARANKNWSQGDILRDEIKKLGWEIEDTENNSYLRPDYSVLHK